MVGSDKTIDPQYFSSLNIFDRKDLEGKDFKIL